ncbi:hypothetical protein N0V88_006738 [Collariella sp. IMI 366227]|nr:hypothetical protein N0V88_006738 [Collariella sp. IMI 366227]
MEFPLKTEALVSHTPGGEFLMTPIIIQDLRPDEVLVEMKYSGICHTDFLVRHSLLPSLLSLPAIAGHEGAGIIRALGSNIHNKTLQVGDAVLLSFTACGRCAGCHTDTNYSRCAAFEPCNLTAIRRPDGTTPATLLDGTPVRSQWFGQSSFARLSVVHENCVVKCLYPEDLGVYAPMGCGYQTGAGTVLNVLKPGPDQTLVVFGAGSVGFAAIMAAATVPVKQIIAVDIVEQRLELARELGATHTINSAEIEGSVVDEVMRLTGNRGVDFAIDATGRSKVIELMMNCLAYGGAAAVVGVPPRMEKIELSIGVFFARKNTCICVVEGDAHPPEVVIKSIIEF